MTEHVRWLEEFHQFQAIKRCEETYKTGGSKRKQVPRLRDTCQCEVRGQTLGLKTLFGLIAVHTNKNVHLSCQHVHFVENPSAVFIRNFFSRSN